MAYFWVLFSTCVAQSDIFSCSNGGGSSEAVYRGTDNATACKNKCASDSTCVAYETKGQVYRYYCRHFRTNNLNPNLRHAKYCVRGISSNDPGSNANDDEATTAPHLDGTSRARSDGMSIQRPVGTPDGILTPRPDGTPDGMSTPRPDGTLDGTSTPHVTDTNEAECKDLEEESCIKGNECEWTSSGCVEIEEKEECSTLDEDSCVEPCVWKTDECHELGAEESSGINYGLVACGIVVAIIAVLLCACSLLRICYGDDLSSAASARWKKRSKSILSARNKVTADGMLGDVNAHRRPAHIGARTTDFEDMVSMKLAAKAPDAVACSRGEMLDEGSPLPRHSRTQRHEVKRMYKAPRRAREPRPRWSR